MTTSPTVSKPWAMTTFSASLSTTSWPGRSSSRSTLGLTLTRILRPPVKTSAVPSSRGLQEDAEAARRLGQPVDLFLERDDLVARLAQRAGEPLVLASDGREVRLGLAQPLLEQVRLPRRVGEPAAQCRDLLFKEGDLRGQDLDLVVVPPGVNAVVTRGHAPHPLLRAELPRPYLSKVNP